MYLYRLEMDVGPRVKSVFCFESLFSMVFILSTAYPFELLGWIVDPWIFDILLVLIVLHHHVSMAPFFFENGGMRYFVAAVSLLLIILFFSFRGPLIYGEKWSLIFLLCSIHVLFLSTREDFSSSDLARFCFVPLALLPLVLLDGSSLSVASSGEMVALFFLGLALALVTRMSSNESLFQRHLSKKLPLWLILILPLIIMTAQFLQFGVKKEGAIVFDAAHSSAAGVDVDLQRSSPLLQNPPGHGRLYSFLKSQGFQARVNELPFSKANLSGAAVVVLPMNQMPLSISERRAIEVFVRSGGGLLVIGDHTNVDSTSSAVNPLLEQFGARLNFDTVWRAPGGISSDLRYLAHPLTLGQERIYFSTGASISLSYSSPLKPFVVSSSFLFSDKGDYANDAFLGNSVLDEDESLGSHVLAAAGSYGWGRVVLLGDSAYFQNTVMVLNREFALRVFHWLERRELLPHCSLIVDIVTFLSILLFLSMVVIKRRRFRTLLPFFVLSMSLAIVLGRAVAFQTFKKAEPGKTFDGDEKASMLLDLAHGNRCHFFWNSLAADMAYDSMDIFFREFLARGWRVDLLERKRLSRDDLEGRNLLLVFHPRLKYSSSELEAIVDFLEQGGNLLFFIGPEYGGGREGILLDLELFAESRPLGFHAPRLFAEEFPLELYYGDGPWPKARVAKLDGAEGLFSGDHIYPVEPVVVSGGRVLIRAMGEAMAVERSLGRGRIILIGDRRLFSDYAFIDENSRLDPRRLKLLAGMIEYLGKTGN